MEEANLTSSRRGMLGRMLVLATGAVGAGFAGRVAAADAAPPATTLVLHGRRFHLSSPSHRSGEVPAPGDRLTGHGELLDGPNGRTIGHFTSAFFAFDSPFAAAGSLELQTFNLETGTIHGLGSVATGADGHFAILGGTGHFAGARGSYVGRQRLRELGGDGTAEFHLTLVGQEALNGV
jgi:hypothetical protein